MARINAMLQAVAAAHRRGDNTPQPIWPLRDGFDHLVRDTCNGVGAKTSVDATSRRLERAR